LLQKRVDGILLVPAREEMDDIQQVKKLHVPLVVLDRRLQKSLTDSVRCDSEQGAYLLTRLLLENGHRRIALLTGSPHVTTATDRLDGYRRALREAGIEESGEIVFFGGFNLESGQQLASQAIALKPCPTAFFAANNFIALGLLKTLRAASLRVPEDVSVVAFDDLPASLLIDPFLTVAAQPAYEMGREATRMLIKKLTGDKSDDPREVILPVEIIERKSVGRLE
jgi:LacI family transcriptional regulator